MFSNARYAFAPCARPAGRGTWSILAVAILLLVAAINAARAQETGPAAWKATFEAGKVAYDEGRFPEAVEHYETILKQHHLSPALLYNLGNAQVKLGHWGEAILRYKQALLMDPHDPDVQANLSFALEQAGIPTPTPSFLDRLARMLSMNRWLKLATAAYWLAALGLALHIAFRMRTILFWRATLAMLLLLTVALTAAAYWYSFHRHPEIVVTTTGQEALFAPLEGSTVHFKTPEGSILRLDNEANGWYKVRRGKQAGWIPAETCARVAL